MGSCLGAPCAHALASCFGPHAAHYKPEALSDCISDNRVRSYKLRGGARPITDLYAEVAKLGEGAFGTVGKWKCKTSGEDFAVKHIRWQAVWHGLWRSEESEETIRRELKTFLMLDHPFVISFKEWFEDPSKGIYFIMELCEGPPLQAFLEDICAMEDLSQRQNFENQSMKYFAQITYALSYIHSFEPPIVHRDLKPDNILLGAHGTESSVKLIDFGLAAFGSTWSQGDSWRAGTPVFMPPEVFLNESGTFTTHMDVWSLAVIFSWIVTAIKHGEMQHPMFSMEYKSGFDVTGLDLWRVFGRQDAWERELFEGQPAEVIELADQLLVYEPEKRLTAAQMLEVEWLSQCDPSSTALLRNCWVVDNLKTFKGLNKFDHMILSLAASNLAVDQVADLEHCFQGLDRDHDGTISLQELHVGLATQGIEIAEDQLRKIFEKTASEEQGKCVCEGDKITWEQWLAATMCQRILRSEDTIRAVFRSLDITGTGTIDCKDLQHLVGLEEASRIYKEMALRIGQSGRPAEIATPPIDLEQFSEIVGVLAAKRSMITFSRSKIRMGSFAKDACTSSMPPNIWAQKKLGGSTSDRSATIHLASVHEKIAGA